MKLVYIRLLRCSIFQRSIMFDCVSVGFPNARLCSICKIWGVISIKFDYRTQSKSIERLEFHWDRLPNVRLTTPVKLHLWSNPVRNICINIYHRNSLLLCMEQTSFITSKCETKSGETKFAQWKCRIHHALHKLRKKIARKTSVVQADSKAAFHTIKSSISLVTSY